MIEIISASRCTDCNICVRVCPANVFEIVPDAAPRIARQEDCQTCFMCELYCPADALYVSPFAEGPLGIDEAAIEAQGLFGSYARELGWERGRAGGTAQDTTLHLRAALDRKKKAGPGA